MRCRRLKRLLICAVVLAVVFGGLPCCALAQEDFPLTDAQRAYIQNHPTVRVGFVQDRIPVSFSDKNGQLAGISRYILDRIAQKCGLNFEYVPLPAGDVTYAFLMEQKLDLVTSVEYNQENQDARGILMSEPYLSSRKVVVARRDAVFSLSDALSVAISSGSQTIHKVLAQTYPNFVVLDYDTIQDCFSAVRSGEADLMILNQYVVEYWLYKPIYEKLKVIPVMGLDDKLCFSAIVAYDSEGKPVGEEGGVLISLLNQAIAQLEEDEIDAYTIQAVMENRYVYKPEDFLYRYRFAFITLACAIVLISALMVQLTHQRMQAMQDRADAKAKSNFLSTMSHEVRTPLNGLIGLNYLMSCKLDDREQLSRYLEQSTTTAKYLLSLVSDILDMSLLHNEDIRIEQRPVDLSVLLSTVAAIVQTGMAEKNLDFRTEEALIYPTIIGDSVRIQQILLNLLDNARKFTPQGGQVRIYARQSAAGDGRVYTEIDVSDTGKGMSEAFQKNIFDAFVQERDTVSKGDQGVGLGLAISHRLAKLMEGEVRFISQVDKGSVFTFAFTARIAEPSDDSQETPAPAPMPRPRILVAEDNELNGEIMLDLLAENGFEAYLAKDGREALELFEQSGVGTYGVILMDLLMPNMDGFAAASAIRALRRADAKTVRIFACSANCTVEDRDKALKCGMDDFLSKPVDVDVLLKKLSEN